ncbi:MAG: MFS transporter [bacterium]
MSTPSVPPDSRRAWLNRNVVAVGLVSLLTDAASEMVLPLLPAFLTVTLGGGAMALGWIEGLADAVASALKLVSGRWADRLGRNQPLMLLGYGISTIARPFVAIATAPWHVLAVRVSDRVGKGIRSSPRDSLLAHAVPAEQRGAAFGFHRAMDHAGAVIGPTIAFLVLRYVSSDLRHLFLLSAIPGVFAVLAVVLGVRESPPVARADASRDAEPIGAASDVASAATSLAGLLTLLAPLAIFTLGKASETFLLLKAGAQSASLTTLPLLWIGLHVVKSACSFRGGVLSDRRGRARVIGAGWALHVGIYAALAFASSRTAVCALFLAYGIPAGLTEGAEKALVSALAPKRGQGTGFGWYHLTLGMSALLASVVFGTLWDAFGPRVAFLTGASLSAIGLALFARLRPDRHARA